MEGLAFCALGMLYLLVLVPFLGMRCRQGTLFWGSFWSCSALSWLSNLILPSSCRLVTLDPTVPLAICLQLISISHLLGLKCLIFFLLLCLVPSLTTEFALIRNYLSSCWVGELLFDQRYPSPQHVRGPKPQRESIPKHSV
jgi:hypothetical protein